MLEQLVVLGEISNDIVGALIGLGCSTLVGAGTAAVAVFKANAAFAKTEVLDVKFHELDKKQGISDAKADTLSIQMNKLEAVIEGINNKIDTLLSRDFEKR